MTFAPRGWYGNPDGHAQAGRQSSGKFQSGSDRAREAGRRGGQISPGRFTPGSDRAREAGRKGGQK